MQQYFLELLDSGIDSRTAAVIRTQSNLRGGVRHQMNVFKYLTGFPWLGIPVMLVVPLRTLNFESSSCVTVS